MQFEIEVPLPSVCDVFESNTITEGMIKVIPGIAKIELQPMPVQHRALTYTEPEGLRIALELGRDVAVGVVANWLYERIKRHPKVRYIRINHREVEVTPDGIRRAVEYSCEIEEQ